MRNDPMVGKWSHESVKAVYFSLEAVYKMIYTFGAKILVIFL